MPDSLARIPLPARYRHAAAILLTDRRYSCDSLLIAADAFAELGRTAALVGVTDAALEAGKLADQLRTEAPTRGPYHVGALGRRTACSHTPAGGTA